MTTLVPAAITTDTHGTLACLGEATTMPGLAITPVARRGRFTGGWTLTHIGSGLRLIPFDTTLAYAREFATVLAGAGIDWTRPAEDLRADRDVRDTVTGLVYEYENAVDDRRPLWWARPSWRQLAPVWTLNGRYHYWSGPFSGLLTELDYLSTEDDYEVAFDPRPTWELECAAPLCAPGGEPTYLIDPFSDDEVSLRSADKTVIRREASEQGWIQHGAYWLCPACVMAHLIDPSDLTGRVAPPPPHHLTWPDQ